MLNNIKVIDFYKGKVYINEIESEFKNEIRTDIENEINKKLTSVEDKSEMEMCVNEECLCEAPNGSMINGEEEDIDIMTQINTDIDRSPGLNENTDMNEDTDMIENTDMNADDLNVNENRNQEPVVEDNIDIDTNGANILDQSDRNDETIDQNVNTNQNTNTNQNFNGNSTTNGNNNALGTVYKVQVGVYQSFSNALNYLASFMQMGYSGVVIPYRNLYAVQLGEFEDLDDAAEFEKELRAKGFDTLLVRVGRN